MKIRGGFVSNSSSSSFIVKSKDSDKVKYFEGYNLTLSELISYYLFDMININPHDSQFSIQHFTFIDKNKWLNKFDKCQIEYTLPKGCKRLFNKLNDFVMDLRYIDNKIYNTENKKEKSDYIDQSRKKWREILKIYEKIREELLKVLSEKYKDYDFISYRGYDDQNTHKPDKYHDDEELLYDIYCYLNTDFKYYLNEH